MAQPAVLVVVLVVVVASLTVVMGSYDDSPVRTTHGDVRGEVISGLAREVKVYWGIPYAKIPARFQRPEPADKWEGVLDATTPPPSCPEVPFPLDIPLIPGPTTGPDENCLIVNLWVPKGCQGKGTEGGLAIMAWIHGGAIHFGSSTVTFYNGQVLAATQCVIVASMNYRQGALGFLSLGTPKAPGNIGFVDQAMALEWIRNNARNFGGDPDRITIFGESAGGTSVGAHIVSPLSRHLFARGIIQSGVVPTAFGRATHAENVATARKLAGMIGCPADDDDAMLACLSKADYAKMGEILRDLTQFRFPAFGIVVDDYFLTKPLTDYSASMEVKMHDVMVGSTIDDGSCMHPFFTGKTMNESSRPVFDRADFISALKNMLFPAMVEPPKRVDMLLKLVEHMYVNSTLADRRDGYHLAIEKIFGDLLYFCPAYASVTDLIGITNVYMYLIAHHSSVSPFPKWMGVIHASELPFVFGRPLDMGHLYTEEEKPFSRMMMNAWANFAKFGNPNSADSPIQWPPVNRDNYPYAILQSPSSLTIDHGLRYPECVFWNEVYSDLVNGPKEDPKEDGQSRDEL